VVPGESGERLLVDVIDTGSGLSSEQVERLFSPFSQADESVTRKHGGTGLGLTICRRLASLMGGSVTLVRSERGVGSCFRVDLPLVPVAGVRHVLSVSAVQPGDPAGAAVAAVTRLSGRILLAEDGADNQRLIAFHLRKAGAMVDVAENGLVALRMIQAAEADGNPYGLLLSDMQMPEMDGYTLARTLRLRGSRLAVVALTAHAMADDRIRCREAGCDDYATKPIDRATLLATCARWMGTRGGVAATLASI
jgi:CheY-like chemotaxis protein